MSEVNELIIKKLNKYPPSIFKLAKRAIELAESLPELSVPEQLKSVVRQIVREEGDEK